MMLIFIIFVLTAVASLTLVLRFWRQANQRMLAEQNVRVGFVTMSNEIRQGIQVNNSTMGYSSISPTVSATAVLTPNANSTSASSIKFTEPIPSFNPSTSGFSATNAANYQQVQYYLSTTDAGNSLMREVQTYNSSGGTNSPTYSTIVTASSSGLLSLTVTYYSATTVTVTLSATEGTYTTSSGSQIGSVGSYSYTVTERVPTFGN